jgi:hypothetical protein
MHQLVSLEAIAADITGDGDTALTLLSVIAAPREGRGRPGRWVPTCGEAARTLAETKSRGKSFNGFAKKPTDPDLRGFRSAPVRIRT